MRKVNSRKKLWEYLESVGIHENSTDQEVKTAKRVYWKKYFHLYKQRQRLNKPEYSVTLTKEEHALIIQAAKSHRMTATAFLRKAALSYLSRTYIVPNAEQIAKLELLLSDCLNEIKAIARQKQKHFWDRSDKLEMIEKRIQRLETDIDRVFTNPPLASLHDSKNHTS